MDNRNEGKWKHLTEDDRSRIARLLEEGRKFSEIGEILGKDPTTISKEVKARRYKKTFGREPGHPCAKARGCSLRNVCASRKGACARLCRDCPWCSSHCEGFTPHDYSCCRENKKPYVCNGCEKRLYGRCRKDKYLYGASHAHKEYREKLVSSRLGADSAPARAAGSRIW